MVKHPVRFTLRIEQALYRKITYIAKQEVRSVNREIEQLIKHHVAAFEAEHGRINV